MRKAAETLIAKLVPGGVGGPEPRHPGRRLAARGGAASWPRCRCSAAARSCLLRDPEFLAPKKGRADALGQAREAWKANRRKEAARRMLAIAARAGWGAGDLDPSASGTPKPERLGARAGHHPGRGRRRVPEGGRRVLPRGEPHRAVRRRDRAARLAEAKAAQGPGAGHRRHRARVKSAFVKLVKEQGPLHRAQGRREAQGPRPDRVRRRDAGAAQEEARRRRAGEAEGPRGRQLPAAAVRAGEAGAVLRRRHHHREGRRAAGRPRREEEYLELSEALQKRDFAAALKYLEDAIAQGAAPLMLLRRHRLHRAHLLDQLRAHGAALRRQAAAQLQRLPGAAVAEDRGRGEGRQGARAAPLRAPSWACRRPPATGVRSCCARSSRAPRPTWRSKLGGDELVLERLLWTVCGQSRPRGIGLDTIRREAGA